MSGNAVADALRHARYNDLVEVTVQVPTEDNNGTTDGTVAATITTSVFLEATLDETNGGIQWENYNTTSGRTDDVNNTADEKLLQRHLRTKRWIFPMLNDNKRNQLYDEAIQNACREACRRFVPSQQHEKVTDNGDEKTKNHILHSLDIGSGTGLLAMLSAKYLEENCDKRCQVKVTSLEMSPAMATIARRVVASNEENSSLKGKVDVSEGHSCEVSPMTPRAWMCTSELLDSGLLGEGWLPAMRDAWARHLHPQAVVVPQRARVYAQVVDGDGISDYWGPHRWLGDFPKDRKLKLCTSSDENDVLLCANGTGPGTTTTGGILVPVHLGKLLENEDDPIRILSDPTLVLEIDVSSKQSIPTPEGRTKSVQFVPTQSGRALGIIYWWELDLFDDKYTYSTQHQKDDCPWQDHWHQCLYVFPKPTMSCTKLSKGQPAILKTSHNDLKISFEVTTVDETSQVETKRLRVANNDDLQPSISAERVSQLNDVTRLSLLRRGINFAFEKKISSRRQHREGPLSSSSSSPAAPIVTLDVSDFSLCSMMAALMDNDYGYKTQITSMESSSGSIPLISAHIAQCSLGLPINDDNVDDSHDDNKNKYEIVQCYPEQLTVDVLGGKTADLVLAEPYYEVLEGCHLQEALNFFNIVNGLKRRQVIKDDTTIIVPSYASVKVCGFESNELASAYTALPATSCGGDGNTDDDVGASYLLGFKHDYVNGLVHFSEQDIIIPSWQYNVIPMTDEVEVAKLDYQSNAKQDGCVTRIPFTRSGTCHGLLVWVEYGLTPLENEEKIVMSTKGRGYNQVIRMLPSPTTVDSTSNDTTLVSVQAKLGKTTNGQDLKMKVAIETK